MRLMRLGLVQAHQAKGAKVGKNKAIRAYNVFQTQRGKKNVFETSGNRC